MKHWVMMNMLLLVGSIFAFSQPYSGEKLSRGLIGIPTEEGMYFSWRMTLEDAAGLQFDLYMGHRTKRILRVGRKRRQTY